MNHKINEYSYLLVVFLFSLACLWEASRGTIHDSGFFSYYIGIPVLATSILPTPRLGGSTLALMFGLIHLVVFLPILKYRYFNHIALFLLIQILVFGAYSIISWPISFILQR